MGVDGRKMSKSYDNAINLSDSTKKIQKKINRMVTDPQRVRREDAGNPDVCSVYSYHKIFTPEDEVKQIDKDCRVAAIGCGDCKKLCSGRIETLVAPVREGREQWINRTDDLNDILDVGNKRAREVTEETLVNVRKAMGLR